MLCARFHDWDDALGEDGENGGVRPRLGTYAHTGADDCPFLETVAVLRPRGEDVRGRKGVCPLPTAAKRQQRA